MKFMIQLAVVVALVLLCCRRSPAVQQMQSASTKGSSSAKAQGEVTADTKQTTIGANDPVITIPGLCADNSGKDLGRADCKSTLTRQEFEDLLSALNPGGQEISPDARRSLAQAYAEMVAFEIVARKSGLEDTVQFRELLSWLRLRTVADLYRRNLQEEYRTPSAGEIDAYYHEHMASFEQVHLARIFIPREDFPPGNKNEFDKKAADAARAARERAATGEDLSQIQKDVYATLGVNPAPATDLGYFRRANLQEKEREEVFSLKPGAVSQVEVEPKSYVVYKVLGKEMLTKDQVKAEIARDISQQRYKEAIKSAIDAAHAQFNETYFGPGMAITIPGDAPTVPRPGRH